LLEKTSLLTTSEIEIIKEYLRLRLKKRVDHNTAIHQLSQILCKSQDFLRKAIDEIITKILEAYLEKLQSQWERKG